MYNAKILDFLLKSTSNISVLNCSSNFEYVKDLLELITIGQFCDSEIDLGLICLKKVSEKNFLIVDGKRRILSLLLLLKAIALFCDGSKNLSDKSAYELSTNILSSIKLNLFGLEKTIYDKIMNNEPISYNEKQTELYRTLQLFKDALPQMDIEISSLMDLVNSLKVNIVIVDKLNERDIFYSINKDLRNLKQILLIKSYLSDLRQGELVNDLYYLFNYKEEIFVSFFKAYLSPKFNRMISEDNDVYYYFVKYFDMIKKYQKFENISASILKTAKLYRNMYHAEFIDADIRNMFIRIISNNGRDTYSYLLELYEDYENKYLSKETFLEVCNIVNTYAWERSKKSSLVGEYFDFTKMTHELNEVIYNESTTKNTIREKTSNTDEDIDSID